MATVYGRVAALQAARLAGLDPEMDRVAHETAARVHALAAAHNVTGEYLAGIGVEPTPGKRGVLDRLVYVDHEAASFIEWGHMQVTRDHRPVRWVDGLHILGRAAGVR